MDRKKRLRKNATEERMCVLEIFVNGCLNGVLACEENYRADGQRSGVGTSVNGNRRTTRKETAGAGGATETLRYLPGLIHSASEERKNTWPFVFFSRMTEYGPIHFTLGPLTMPPAEVSTTDATRPLPSSHHP